MRQAGKILIAVLAIPFGAAMVWYAEVDDSPGGQLIGLLVAIAGAVGVFKAVRRSKSV